MRFEISHFLEAIASLGVTFSLSPSVNHSLTHSQTRVQTKQRCAELQHQCNKQLLITDFILFYLIIILLLSYPTSIISYYYPILLFPYSTSIISYFYPILLITYSTSTLFYFFPPLYKVIASNFPGECSMAGGPFEDQRYYFNDYNFLWEKLRRAQ